MFPAGGMSLGALPTHTGQLGASGPPRPALFRHRRPQLHPLHAAGGSGKCLRGVQSVAKGC